MRTVPEYLEWIVRKKDTERERDDSIIGNNTDTLEIFGGALSYLDHFSEDAFRIDASANINIRKLEESRLGFEENEDSTSFWIVTRVSISFV